MSDRTRYQAQSIYQEQGDVTSYRGVDPVTGLPVLIYRFSDAASPQLARLDSEHLPRLLAWRDDDSGGIMVVAWSSAFVPVSSEPLDNLQLLDSARALSDAAAAGVTHGDLKPERFLLAGDSVVIEGFGVPWTGSEVEPEDDVRAWARSIRQLGHKPNSAVERLLDDIDAGTDLQPAGLLTRLTNVLLRSDVTEPETVPQSPAEPEPEPAEHEPEHPEVETATNALDRSWDDFAEADDQSIAFSGTASQVPDVEEIELEFDAGAGAPEQDESGPDSAVFIPSATYASERLEETAADVAVDTVADTPAAERPRPTPGTLPAGGSSSYLKSLDPEPRARTGKSVGVTGQSGSAGAGRTAGRQDEEPTSEQDGNRSNRRVVMIIVLVVLSAVLVTLLFVLRQRDMDGVPASVTAGVTYVIDVLVEPDDLPPVNLFVLQSPADSQFGPNTALGTAPRRMALDTEGTWVFEGRFQGRLSEPVTIQIPEERSSTVTIVIPPEETDGQ